MAASQRNDRASSRSGGAQDRAADQTLSDGEDLTNILNGIPGAWERVRESIMQAKRGKTVPLPKL